MSLRLLPTGQVYWVHDGRARPIGSPDALSDHFAHLDLEPCDAETLASLKVGPQVAPRVTVPTNYSEMRVSLVQDLTGRGLEFGPGATPMQISPFASVRYVDRFSDESYADCSSGARNEAEHFMSIDLVDDVLQMDSIEDSSVNFIIGAHVIEHVGNPLRLFEVASRKLKPGGKLVLVVPDKLRTFDNARPTTPVDRLVLSYYLNDESREIEGHFEVARYVDGLPWSEAFERAQKTFEARQDTHLHTYTFESFTALAQLAAGMFGYSDIWSDRGHFPTDPTCLEFYFVLTREQST